jgi:hypothetical protein
MLQDANVPGLFELLRVARESPDKTGILVKQGDACNALSMIITIMPFLYFV